MKWRALFMALMLNIAGPAVAERSAPSANLTEADAAAIRQMINDQINAFGRDDADGAFALASPDIQKKFGTAERYMEMVRSGYGPVYRPQRYEFRDLALTPWGIGQLMTVFGPDGQEVMAVYLMERQGDGTWRSDGCLLISPDDEENIPQA
ncbi:MAG: DUF4864 domain-containing protein [Myxococcota bacterium]